MGGVFSVKCDCVFFRVVVIWPSEPPFLPFSMLAFYVSTNHRYFHICTSHLDVGTNSTWVCVDKNRYFKPDVVLCVSQNTVGVFTMTDFNTIRKLFSFNMLLLKKTANIVVQKFYYFSSVHTTALLLCQKKTFQSFRMNCFFLFWALFENCCTSNATKQQKAYSP